MIKLLLVIVFLSTPMLADPAEVAGRWRWTMERIQGEQVQVNLTLQQKGTNLTGTLRSLGQAQQIEDATLSEDGEFSFAVRRQRDGRVFETKYKGKATEGEIRGILENIRYNESRTQAWHAVRIAREHEYFTGEWKVTIKRPEGNNIELFLELKQDDKSVGGLTKLVSGIEATVVKGTANEKEADFTVHRERDGRLLISRYVAKLENEDKMVGQVISNWGAEGRTFQFEAQRVR